MASGTAKDEGWRSNDDSQLCILESRRGKRRSFDWSKQRSLRHFLELCKDENLPVVLRISRFLPWRSSLWRYTGLDTGEECGVEK